MAFTYSLLNGFAIAFLMILYLTARNKSVHLADTRCFCAVVVMTILALIFDIFAWQLDGRQFAAGRYFLWIANIFSYAIAGIMSLTWLYYTGLKLNRIKKIPLLVRMLVALPCLFLIVISVLTPWTHWLFDLDAGNVYQRGPLFYLQMVIAFAYIMCATVWALYHAYKVGLYIQRREYLVLASFLIFPLIGGLLQFLFYGVSIVWPCSALSLMLVYVNMQNQKISLDALTGLNNRGQLDNHLYDCVEHADDDARFAFYMLDIDEFKIINDELGHTVGDSALVDAANILSNVLINTNSFLARYGGDEFAIIYYYNKDEQPKALISKIANEADRFCRSKSKPYRLVFSVGYVCFDRERFSTSHEMITAADSQMYLQKKQHKSEKY